MSKIYIKSSYSALFVVGLIFHSTVMACTLTMGYRSSERLPLISREASNSGLYQHLYSLAADKIGCKLKIERGPKKRILKRLNQGTIDFYPGFSFSLKRAENVFYIENGLPGGDIGISLNTMENITDIKQLKGYTLLTALGSVDTDNKLKGITIHKVREMTIDKAISLINKKRGDFYIYNKSSIEYYINKNKVDNIKIHSHCCGEIEPLYLGFSKKSIHYKQQDNPDIDNLQAINILNNPQVLSKKSIAYKFKQALKELKSSGKTQELYNQYYE